MSLSNKVRVYDLAKELRQDTKRVIEDARREGVDVSVPSNSIPKEVAEKIRNKYLPKKEPVAHRTVKVVKRAARPEGEEHPSSPASAPGHSSPVLPASMRSSAVSSAPVAPRQTVVSPAFSSKVLRARVVPPITPAPTAPPPVPVPPSVPTKTPVMREETPPPAPTAIAPVAIEVPIIAPPPVTVAEKPVVTAPPPVIVAETIAEKPVVITPPPVTAAETIAEKPVAPRPARTVAETPRVSPAPVAPAPPAPERRNGPPARHNQRPHQSGARGETPRAPALRRPPHAPVTPRVMQLKPVTPPVVTETPLPSETPVAETPKFTTVPPRTGPQVRQLRLTPEALKSGLRHGDRAPVVQPATPAPATARPAEEKRDRKRGRDRHRGGDRNNDAPRPNNQLVGTPGENAKPQITYIPPADARGGRGGRGGARPTPGKPAARGAFLPNGRPDLRGGGRFDRTEFVQALTLEQRIKDQMNLRGKLKEARLVEGSTVKDFAEKLGIKPKEVVALLLQRGVFATINQALNQDVATELAERFGYHVTFVPFEEMVAEEEFEELVATDADDTEDVRAPVVTVMGHVDHGKTSLLDAIRHANVAAGEAGGITQHIGAYSVQVATPDNPDEKRRVVFLDTPGHEAFTMMRARGAKATDVVILVVAADDGVMPQTIEAIEHSKAAGVPIIVAINKIDKPEANPERVKQGLTAHGLTPVEWGGETEMVEVSAKKRENLNTLLETVLLTSDILDLKASATRLASGVVLEAKLDRGRGSVATVLVQQGTLRVQDPFIVGQIFGKVRALYNDRGEPVTSAGPATPVEVLGLQGVPQAGDAFQVVSDTARAQQTAHHRQMMARQTALAQNMKRGIEMLGQAETKELLVIVKADVQGSVEVLRSTLEKLSTEKVSVKVVRSGVGAITESDVLLASATQNNSSGSAVVIIGFNARPEVRAAEIAKEWNVEIRLHSVIYKVEEEIHAAMVGLLDAIEQEKILGRAEIRDIFRVPRAGVIAGCMVRSGIIRRTAKARLIRDGIVAWEGNISSLRRFKEDVGEVREGFECGIGLENFNDIKANDQIEAYIIEKVAATEL